MKKSKVVISIVMMVSGLMGSVAQAGFQCEVEGGDISVAAEHAGPFANPFSQKEDQDSLVTVKKGENVIFEAGAKVKFEYLRVGQHYAYNFDDETNTSFSISEFATISKPGVKCDIGSRAPCDFEWVSIYKGYLNFEGELHVLVCQAQ